jgi:hypothetical protein
MIVYCRVAIHVSTEDPPNDHAASRAEDVDDTTAEPSPLLARLRLSRSKAAPPGLSDEEEELLPEEKKRLALAEEKESQALFQTKVLVAAAFFLGGMVWVLAKNGYAKDRALPREFVYACIFVAVVGVLTAFAEIWLGFLRDLFLGPESNGHSIPKWVERLKAWRRSYQPQLVYLLTAVLGFGFSALVWKTGLAIESPYIPLVTAPAVFGPFVARTPGTVAALLVIVAGLLIVITLKAPEAPCEGCLSHPVPGTPLHAATPTELRMFEADLRKAEEHRPGPGVYLTVGLAFLLTATGISITRWNRDKKVRQQKLTLQAERDVLQGRITTLRERFGAAAGEAPEDPPAQGPPEKEESP